MGPFETDVSAISAALASHPLRPRVWDASPLSNERQAELKDGSPTPFSSALPARSGVSGWWTDIPSTRCLPTQCVDAVDMAQS